MKLIIKGKQGVGKTTLAREITSLSDNIQFYDNIATIELLEYIISSSKGDTIICTTIDIMQCDAKEFKVFELK